MILEYLKHLKQNKKELKNTNNDPNTIGEKADNLYEKLKKVRLQGTEEDKILRNTFRKENKAISDWPIEKFFDELEKFIEKNIVGSQEYLSELSGASNANGKILCWGIIGS